MGKQLFLAGLLAFLLLGCIQQPAQERKFFVNDYGLLQAVHERGLVEASEQLLEEDANKTTYKIAFKSLDKKAIYGLLIIPKNVQKQKMPAAVFQPGAGVAKEGGAVGVGDALAGAGFAVLVVDQRGVGDTGGKISPLEEEFNTFRSGGFVQQQLMVYDYMRAFDYLRQRKEVDAEKIVFGGESNGGRVAIIAAALEKRAKGVLAISTAGYGQATGGGDAGAFFASFDPSYYVHLLAPRPVVMMHSPADAGIPIADARDLFKKAGEPKRFVEVRCEYHGYCKQIAGEVAAAALEITG